MRTNQPRFLAGALVSALALTILAPGLTAQTAQTTKTVIDPDADRILHACCKYLAEAKAFCVNVEVWKDVVLPDGQKIQTTRTLEVQEQRPDQLHIEVHSPRDSREFWYRNKSLTMLDRAMNLYGVMEMPGTIDKAIDTLEERFGVEIPLGDVLVADPYHNLMEIVETAEDLGKVTTLGEVCNHLAFTGPNADFQIWIANGPKPLPKKIVINFKTMTGSPQVTQIFSAWDVVSPISESVFIFAPPEGAGKIQISPKQSEDPAAEAPTDAPAKK